MKLFKTTAVTAILLATTITFANKPSTLPTMQAGFALKELGGEDAALRNIVVGYLMGTTEMGNGVLHCIPNNVDDSTKLEVIMRYAKLKPEELRTAFTGFISNALGATFPCTSFKSRLYRWLFL